MTNFRAMAIEAADLANTPAALAGIADELEALIFEENFTGYQHARLTVLLNALRMASETNNNEDNQ